MNKFHFTEHKQDTRKHDWLIGHIISIRYDHHVKLYDLIVADLNYEVKKLGFFFSISLCASSLTSQEERGNWLIFPLYKENHF